MSGGGGFLSAPGTRPRHKFGKLSSGAQFCPPARGNYEIYRLCRNYVKWLPWLLLHFTKLYAMMTYVLGSINLSLAKMVHIYLFDISQCWYTTTLFWSEKCINSQQNSQNWRRQSFTFFLQKNTLA